ncbi:NrdH-redoxin [Salmonella enterica subsp. enterica serovar Choleraesuis]|nr:NrdH-redoxin [Salmonella enterica subsp. enterica serovar Choleraesuis]
MFITIYTRKNSLPCFATQRALRQQGLAFVTHCVDDEPELEESLAEQGFTEFPVVITDNFSWSGFRPDMINRLRLHSQAANC